MADKILANYLLNLKRQCRGRQVPRFSKKYGSHKSKALFVLEAPGPRVIRTDFVCPTNPDQTAKKTTELLRRAKLHPKDCLMWNIVPWVNCVDGRKKNPSTAEVKEGVIYLNRLIRLMPHLRAIVLVGKKAQKASAEIRLSKKAKIFDAQHPSPLNRRNHSRAQRDFCKVSKFIYSQRKKHD